jgi:hydroxymethylbilane synthase
VRIGTRASPLALAQARHVAGLLQDAGAEVEIVEITTTGDRDRAAPDKEKWVKELELALRYGRGDACVHSAKDVPTSLPEGLTIAGVPAREDPRDVLCLARGVVAAGIEELPADARVGTSSLRRAALLRATRPDLEIVEVRGNVGTRLGLLGSGDLAAVVLAAAGLRRLGHVLDEVGTVLSCRSFVPAAGQGTLALECRADDETTRAALGALSDRDAADTLEAERSAVRTLGADCHSAVGARAMRRDEDRLQLRGWVGSPDGSAVVTDVVDALPGELPQDLGRRVGERLLAAGAGPLLALGPAQGVQP